MIGNDNIEVSVTLNIVAIIISSVLLLSIFYGSRNIKRTLMSLTTMLVIFGNLHEIIAIQKTMITSEFGLVSAVVVAAAMLMYCIAFVFMIIIVVSDDEGILGRKSKKMNTIMIFVLAAPIVINVLVHMFYQDVFVLGFGVTIALELTYLKLVFLEEQRMSKLEHKVQKKENKILTEQIHPHFIFNSLMAIEELCYKDSELAATSIENFAGYLRSNIEVLDSDEPIHFEKELRNIKQYIELEKAASSREFDVIYDLEETDFDIPALTIQPLVENSIRHGLEQIQEKGIVRISTRRKGDFVIITVFDNGTFKEKSEGDRKGIGLANVRDRIEQTDGGNFKLVSTEQGTEAIVTLQIV